MTAPGNGDDGAPPSKRQWLRGRGFTPTPDTASPEGARATAAPAVPDDELAQVRAAARQVPGGAGVSAIRAAAKPPAAGATVVPLRARERSAARSERRTRDPLAVDPSKVSLVPLGVSPAGDCLHVLNPLCQHRELKASDLQRTGLTLAFVGAVHEMTEH